MPGLAELSRSWRGWLVSLAIVAAAAGAPLTQPAALDGTNPALFAAVLSATLTAIVLVPLLVARHRLHPWLPFVSAAVLLVLGAAAYVYSNSIQGRCVVRHNGRSVFIGTELTKDVGVPFRTAHPEETDADLL